MLKIILMPDIRIGDYPTPKNCKVLLTIPVHRQQPVWHNKPYIQLHPDYRWKEVLPIIRYWSNATHPAYGGAGGDADYVCFGRAMGYMVPFGGWSDVHGAGAQRSDPKASSFASFTYNGNGYYNAHAPEGDAVRIYNYVRLVRNLIPTGINEFENHNSINIYP